MIKFGAIAALALLACCAPKQAPQDNPWNESEADLRVRAEIERINGPEGDEPQALNNGE